MELSFENAQNNFIGKEISQVGFLAKVLRDSDEHAGWLSGSALKSTPVEDWMCGNEFLLTDREI